jgi:hypothetical protein
MLQASFTPRIKQHFPFLDVRDQVHLERFGEPCDESGDDISLVILDN